MATGNVPNIDIVEKCENHDCSSDFFHVLNTMRIDRKVSNKLNNEYWWK